MARTAPKKRWSGPPRAEEIEALIEQCRGLTAEEIAEARGMSPGTVRTQLNHLRQKLVCETVAEMVIAAIGGELISAEDFFPGGQYNIEVRPRDQPVILPKAERRRGRGPGTRRTDIKSRRFTIGELEAGIRVKPAPGAPTAGLVAPGVR